MRQCSNGGGRDGSVGAYLRLFCFTEPDMVVSYFYGQTCTQKNLNDHENMRQALCKWNPPRDLQDREVPSLAALDCAFKT